jgi:hypothetical protein
MLVKRLIPLAMICMLFLACATQSREGRPDGEELKEAVTKYWTYRVQYELGKAYYYENVAYTKLSTKEFYMKAFGGSKVIVKGFDLLEVGKEGSASDGYTPVKLKLRMSWPGSTFRVPDTMENEITDLWIKKEGRWYHMTQQMTGVY